MSINKRRRAQASSFERAQAHFRFFAVELILSSTATKGAQSERSILRFAPIEFYLGATGSKMLFRRSEAYTYASLRRNRKSLSERSDYASLRKRLSIKRHLRIIMRKCRSISWRSNIIYILPPGRWNSDMSDVTICMCASCPHSNYRIKGVASGDFKDR